MRKLLPLVAALAAACGSSSNDNNNTPPVSGTIAGHAFTPADTQALVAGTGATPCPLSLGGFSVNAGIKAFAIEFASFAGACTDLESPQCRLHEDDQTVTLIFARLNPAGTEPTIAPGTYTISSNLATPTPLGDGTVYVAFARALATTGTTCAGTPSDSTAGGTLRIDSAGNPITGYVALTFTDGSTLTGNFSAPVCAGASRDVCALATSQAICTLPPACVP
jgi:hypothetical protein